MKLDVKYYAVHDLKKIVATTQRTASVSMIEALAPMQLGSHVTKISYPSEVLLFKDMNWPVLLWIRHPLDRLASAYTIFGRRGLRLDDFLKRVLNEMNPHWSPASKLHMLGKYFLPTTIYPFENLAETWGFEMPGYALEHWDKSHKYPSWAELRPRMSVILLDRIMSLFHDDLALYRWARSNGVHQVAA